MAPRQPSRQTPAASRYSTTRFPSCLRASYAVPGTDLAERASCLRASYAVSGTEIAERARA
eukprot:2531195-Rhodomonas_salina.1